MRIKKERGQRNRSLSSIIISFTMTIMIILFTLNIENVEAAGGVPKITYQAHVQVKGWMKTVKNGQTAGTTGQSKRLEAIKINLKDGKKSAIKYRAHVQNDGWQGWKSSGQIAGTIGKSLRLEAIQIKLTGNYAKKYDVYYRVHVANAGWLAWTSNGKTAGSTGAAIRAEAIEIKLVKKGTIVSGTGIADISKTELTSTANVQGKGWMSTVSEGSTCGTTGQSKRLEAIKVNLKDYDGKSGIRYIAHVSNIGWQGWKTSGQLAGTTGKGQQIEAMKILLTGSIAKYYDVYYRLHVAGKGWLGWAKNGETAGTTGGGIRAEAVEIKLVAKSVSFDKGGAAYIDASKKPGDMVVEEALKWAGVTKYVWGGNSLSSGADCSGFVCAVFEKCGKNYWPYRVAFADNYSSIGTNIGTDTSRAKAGDIVVYPGHVGIAIDNNSIIQCQNSTGATVRSYEYMNRWWGGVRMIIRPYGF